MNNRAQLSIIAALLVAVILITSVAVTYSIIRNSPIQDQPPIQNAIDETNFAIKQIAGFTVGYYGSVLQVTGNSTYANMSAISYFQSGLVNIGNMHPEWATSLELGGSQLGTYWFTNMSHSSGSFAVNYNLTGLGISGVNYTTSCKLSTSILSTAGTQAVLNVTQDDSEPLVSLGKQNFKFYRYDMTNSSWDLTNPANEPTVYGNGTYQIDIPSGVDPYSYVIQVEDQRGIIVVASSFNSYSCTLMWGNISANGILNQALYAHTETTNIGGTSYYLQKPTIADGAGSNLQASMSAVGQQSLGRFVYPLTGVTSIPASTWTIYYRAWKDAPPSIAYDASSSITQSASQNYVSWSHTVGSGSYRLLLVTVSVFNSGGTPASCSGCTYNGVVMTQQASNTYSTNPQVRSYVFSLTNPPSGSHVIIANFSASTISVGGAVSYSGVDQTNPIQTSNSAVGSATTELVSVNVAGSGRAVYGSLSSYRTTNPATYTITAAGGQNSRWVEIGSNCKGDGEDKLNVGSGAVPISWTTSRTVSYVCLAVVINPATVNSAGHCDVDILVRKSDGTARNTVATNTAASADLTSTATTQSGTYSWVAYNVVSQTDYLEIDYYLDVTAAVSGINAYLRVDDASLATADQTRAANIILPSQYAVQTVVELLQNGTMRWLGQSLTLTTQAIPPIPVKSFHVNETLNGMDSEAPFQIEDWASEYRIPLGLTNNASIFNSGTMLVFLVNPNVSRVTLWWNGSDTATQTPLAYTNTHFNDNPAYDPSFGILSNSMMALQIYYDSSTGKFAAISTLGSSSSSATFMRINNQNSTYGAAPAYVIVNGTVRDIVHQEAEWSNGVTNCSDIYSDIVLTLPANSPYYTYQLRLMFVESQRARNITDLCPIMVSNLNGQLQTENGTAGGFPIVSNNTGVFFNYSSSTWAHHWSQTISGVKGAGIMFTDSANQQLYIFDSIAGNKTGGLKPNSAAGTIELLPVTLYQANINPPFDSRATDILWYGAVATFDGTTPIYDNYDQTGLWTLVECPPSVTVTTGS